MNFKWAEVVVRICSVNKHVPYKAWGLQLYLKGGSGTGVFLWILWNFLVHIFSYNTSGGCFWMRFSYWNSDNNMNNDRGRPQVHINI